MSLIHRMICAERAKMYISADRTRHVWPDPRPYRAQSATHGRGLPAAAHAVGQQGWGSTPGVLRAVSEHSASFVDRQQRVMVAEVAGDRHIGKDLRDQICIGPRHDGVGG